LLEVLSRVLDELSLLLSLEPAGELPDELFCKLLL